MTQVAIRCHKWVFILATCIVFAVGTFFIIEASSTEMLNSYLHEMHRRIAYMTAVLEWLPSPQALSASDWAKMEKRVHCGISFLPLDQSTVRDIAVMGEPPYTAYEYSPILDSVVAVTEVLPAGVSFGCREDMLVIGCAFLFMTAALVLMLVRAANLCALVWPQRVVLSRALVVMAHAVPVLMGAGMVVCLTQLERQCALLSWRDETQRSSVMALYAYATLDAVFPNRLPLSLLADTFGAINTEYIQDDSYSVHVVDYAAQTIDPPLRVGGTALQELLLSSTVAAPRYTEYLEDDGLLIATRRMRASHALIAVVRSIKEELPGLFTGCSVSLMCLVLIPQIVFCVAALSVFPYASLGTLRCSEVWEGPWAWRASRKWPLWKLVQGVVLVVFTVAMLTYYVTLVGGYYSNSDTFTENMRSRITTGLNVSQVGSALLTSYASIVKNVGWSVNYLKFLDSYTYSMEASADEFYQAVLTAVDATEFTAATVVDRAAKVPPESLPLLMNKDAMLAFMRLYADIPEILEFEAAVRGWDAMMLFFLLTSDSAGMRNGNPDYANVMFQVALGLGGQAAVTEVNGIVLGTLKYAQEYADIAHQWEQQTVANTALTALYKGPLGREVTGLESESYKDMVGHITPAIDYDSYQVWMIEYMVIYIAIAVVMLAVLAVTDYFYTARFYGASVSVHTGRKGEKLVPSNDYTSPSSYLTINHHHLWSGVRHSTAAVVSIAALCVCGIVVCGVYSCTTVHDILNVRYYNAAVSSPVIDSAKDGGAMEYTAALWLRAFLSNVKSDISQAAEVENSWTVRKMVRWADGIQPADVVTVTATGGTNLREAMRYTSNLVSANSNGNGIPLYHDFARYLMEFGDYVVTDVVMETSTCLSSSDSVLFAKLFEDLLIEYLYFSHRPMKLKGIVEGFEDVFDRNPSCTLDTTKYMTYIARLERLRKRCGFEKSRTDITEQMEYNAVGTERSSRARLVAENVARDEPGLTVSPIVWAPMILSWLCLPLVIVIYRASKNIHSSIYSR